MWVKDGKAFKNPILIERTINNEVKQMYTQVSNLTKSNSLLPTLGYTWIENTVTTIYVPKKYSKLKIVRLLGDNWQIIKAQLDAAGLLDQFILADYLKEDDPFFQEFISTLPEELVNQLDNCLWEAD